MWVASGRHSLELAVLETGSLQQGRPTTSATGVVKSMVQNPGNFNSLGEELKF